MDTKTLSGGCINNAMKVVYYDGSGDLLKFNDRTPDDMFMKEAHGLVELKKARAIRVPEVLIFDTDFILTEFISEETKKYNFFDEFGRNFARLHKYTTDKPGFFEDNYLGSSLQVNRFKDTWKDFFIENRLLFQYKLAEKNGHATADLRSSMNKLLDKVPVILDEVKEPPSLLHGDLWSGNYITDENGSACLIDPAVYYGHREADLAMTRVFGTFDTRFYVAYSEEYPLDEGSSYRENLYKLYHLLNHLNLFGSAYYLSTISLIKFYL